MKKSRLKSVFAISVGAAIGIGVSLIVISQTNTFIFLREVTIEKTLSDTRFILKGRNFSSVVENEIKVELKNNDGSLTEISGWKLESISKNTIVLVFDNNDFDLVHENIYMVSINHIDQMVSREVKTIIDRTIPKFDANADITKNYSNREIKISISGENLDAVDMSKIKIYRNSSPNDQVKLNFIKTSDSNKTNLTLKANDVNDVLGVSDSLTIEIENVTSCKTPNIVVFNKPEFTNEINIVKNGNKVNLTINGDNLDGVNPSLIKIKKGSQELDNIVFSRENNGDGSTNKILKLEAEDLESKVIEDGSTYIVEYVDQKNGIEKISRKSTIIDRSIWLSSAVITKESNLLSINIKGKNLKNLNINNFTISQKGYETNIISNLSEWNFQAIGDDSAVISTESSDANSFYPSFEYLVKIKNEVQNVSENKRSVEYRIPDPVFSKMTVNNNIEGGKQTVKFTIEGDKLEFFSQSLIWRSQWILKIFQSDQKENGYSNITTGPYSEWNFISTNKTTFVFQVHIHTTTHITKEFIKVQYNGKQEVVGRLDGSPI